MRKLYDRKCCFTGVEEVLLKFRFGQLEDCSAWFLNERAVKIIKEYFDFQDFGIFKENFIADIFLLKSGADGRLDQIRFLWFL